MDSAPGHIAAHLAVYASADTGQTGRELRDAMVCTTSGPCQFFTGSWAIHVREANPTISPHIDALTSIPDAHRRVNHLFIEQSFAGDAPHNAKRLAHLVALEEQSMRELRELLRLLAPTLQTLVIVRLSIDPVKPSLQGCRLLEGLRFPCLRELSVQGSAETARTFELPISVVPGYATSLRRLQIPSEMHHYRLDAWEKALPVLAQLNIQATRRIHTVMHCGVRAREAFDESSGERSYVEIASVAKEEWLSRHKPVL